MVSLHCSQSDREQLTESVATCASVPTCAICRFTRDSYVYVNVDVSGILRASLSFSGLLRASRNRFFTIFLIVFYDEQIDFFTIKLIFFTNGKPEIRESMASETTWESMASETTWALSELKGYSLKTAVHVSSNPPLYPPLRTHLP